MKDDNKTKTQLVHELTELRSQNAALKNSITGSISAELAAEEASRYAESIVETVREPLLVLDADLKIISANRNFYTTFKVFPGETLGCFIYDLGNKQWDIPRLREFLEEVLPEKQAFDDFEVTHDFLSIGHKIMLLNAHQIYRKDIGAKMILLAIEDITERREIENGLEKVRKELETTKISEDEAREYAESIINTVRVPLIALDHDLRVVTASRSFYVVFKVKPEETVGQLIYDLGNKQWDIPKLRELLETILPQKATFDNYEVEHDFDTIGRRIMLLNARQIQRVLGKERIILLAIEDITEKKDLERRIVREKDATEAANKELEAFSSSISHDLRAPLRGIDGWSLALLEDYSSLLDEQGKTYLNRVRSETQRMGYLIDDLLQLSHLTRVEMCKEKVNLSSIAQHIAARLQESEPQRQVKFKIQKGMSARGDAHLLEIALTNLLDNAFKFTGKTPQAHIEFGQTEIEGQNTFFVRDNGAGFDMAFAKKLFGAFQRMHKASEFPGTGIGLVIVQRILHRHGGRIWAKSAINHGATFYFTLEESV